MNLRERIYAALITGELTPQMRNLAESAFLQVKQRIVCNLWTTKDGKGMRLNYAPLNSRLEDEALFKVGELQVIADLFGISLKDLVNPDFPLTLENVLGGMEEVA
jgi:hypothetical protein